ncbi:uncharacterized protein [Clytia hemisphaerica]|uniref:uncharacterized protein n=1 Tax=Clytia hemisphaerica TaxID=252671 RepID=UPI0034D6A82A
MNQVNFNEASTIEIRLSGNDLLVFSCIYRSPTNNDTSAENSNKLNHVIKDIASSNKYSHKCFVGDFNFPTINWKNWTTPHLEESKANQALCLEYLSPLCLSDHSCLTFSIKCDAVLKPKSERYKYEDADFEAMKQDLNSDDWYKQFPEMANSKSTEELWQLFRKKNLDIGNRFVPIKIIGGQNWKKKGKMPIGVQLRKEIAEKRRLHRKWMKSSPEEKEYNRAKYTRHEDHEKANILQRQFCSVFTKEAVGELPAFEKRTDSSIGDIHISEEMVQNQLKELNHNKSFGPDEIHPRILAELSDYLSLPLAVIMNKSLVEGSLPRDWKVAHVTPIYKNKGPQNLAVNYRPGPAVSGIPQGSVTGPILFVLYINDLPEKVISLILLFADDTKIFKEVNCIEDSVSLQNDIDTLVEWSKDWLLQFHPEKCHVLTLGKIGNIKHAHPYSLDGRQLEHVFEEKDLGILIDSELTFEEHIAKQVKKANAILGIINRGFVNMSTSTFRTLYCTFVRPHLEYAQSVWSPFLRKHVNLIEGVQRRATKLVHSSLEDTFVTWSNFTSKSTITKKIPSQTR